VNSLSNQRKQVTFKGRSLGIVALTAFQLLIGVIHVFSGLWLLASEVAVSSQVSLAYDIYTLVFGLLVLVFAVFIWQGKKAGWIGTVGVSLFVIVADALTLLDLPSIPGIPKFPALTEIAHSVLIVVYLCSSHVRKKYLR
jgi:heme A synthase